MFDAWKDKNTLASVIWQKMIVYCFNKWDDKKRDNEEAICSLLYQQEATAAVAFQTVVSLSLPLHTIDFSLSTKILEGLN